jgi:hypothetical protein
VLLCRQLLLDLLQNLIEKFLFKNVLFQRFLRLEASYELLGFHHGGNYKNFFTEESTYKTHSHKCSHDFIHTTNHYQNKHFGGSLRAFTVEII